MRLLDGSPDLITKALQLSQRADLQKYRDSYFDLLLLCTKIVAVGLLLEAPEIVHDVYGIMRRKSIELRYWLAPSISRREHSVPGWMKILTAIGWLLIVLGVIGEFVSEAYINKYDTALQRLNDTIISEAMKDIITQGPRSILLAKAAPELKKQLAPFAGQRVDLFVCGRFGSQDGETLSTWGAIASTLNADGAKWKVEHGGLEYFDRCSPSGGQPLGQGMMVFVSKRAPTSTMEAAKALGEGLAKALPPSANNMPGIIDPDFTHLMRQKSAAMHLTVDKDSPWAIVADDPDLITVLIGAHPQQ
jgi:hypothetical protein